MNKNNQEYLQNSIILQNVTLEDLEAMVTRVIDERLKLIQPTIIEQDKDKSYGLITRKEAAKRLRISLVTLDNWTKIGVIKARKVGTRLRYTDKDIEEALKNVCCKK